MGFKDNGEQWTQHEDNFTSLLSNLGSGNDAKLITLPTAEKSLEKKSQMSKARVHYKKFTRGKDLAQRSEKDIANIFGRKTLERLDVQPQETKEEVAENGTEDKSFGVVTVKAGNMTDYFKSKLGKLGNITSSKGDYALNGRDDYEAEIGACTGFGFSVKNNQDENDNPSLGINKINFVSSQNSTTEEKTEDKTSNKRKRDSEEWTEVVPKKKKKSKKKEMAFDNLGSDINPAEEVCYDNPCLKQADSPQITENSDEKGKKKRVTFSSPITEVLNKSDESIKTEKPKKKKKNKHLNGGIDNLGCENNSFEESNQLGTEESEKKSKKKKKLTIDNDENSVNVTKSKKKKKQEEVGIDNLACEEISVNEKNEEIKRYKMKKKAMEHGLVNPACEENSPTQELKKKKKKSKENGLDNLGCEENSISEDTEVPKKKNKKQKNDSFEISVENIPEMSQNDDETKTKKKKKKNKEAEEDDTVESPPKKLKKKSKSKESGIENLGCEINTVEENIASINSEIDNYQTELENELNVKKAKKQKKRDVENPEETSEKEDQKQVSSEKKNKSKDNTISDNEQSTNDETNFQKNSENPLENTNPGQETTDNTYENRNNRFENRNNRFDNRNNRFDNRNNNFNNNFTRRSFDGQRGPNNFNRRSFDGPNNFRTFNRPFDDRNGPRRHRFNPDKVDKSSLKHILKPGELKLSFAGSNITKIIGYGVATELLKSNRPQVEPDTKTSDQM